MEGLDLLKKGWKQQSHPGFTHDEIYGMIFKRSASIVRWLLFICIAELVLWSGLSLLSKSSYEIIERLGATQVMWGINIAYYLVFFLFIYLFYKNYRSIRATESIKELMRRIFRTRKTVHYFIAFNVLAMLVSLVVVNYYYYTNSEVLFELMAEKGQVITDEPSFMRMFFIAQAVVAVVMVGLLLLFYRLAYGILLGRLVKNYRALERIEKEKE